MLLGTTTSLDRRDLGTMESFASSAGENLGPGRRAFLGAAGLAAAFEAPPLAELAAGLAGFSLAGAALAAAAPSPLAMASMSATLGRPPSDFLPPDGFAGAEDAGAFEAAGSAASPPSVDSAGASGAASFCAPSAFRAAASISATDIFFFSAMIVVSGPNRGSGRDPGRESVRRRAAPFRRSRDPRKPGGVTP